MTEGAERIEERTIRGPALWKSAGVVSRKKGSNAFEDAVKKGVGPIGGGGSGREGTCGKDIGGQAGGHPFSSGTLIRSPHANQIKGCKKGKGG